MISNKSDALFFFAHQDDEFAILETLSKEISKGNNVICVYLTDGGVKAEERNAESLRVLERIGIHPKQVLFKGQMLGIKDGELVNHLNAAKDCLLPYLKSLGDIERIYVPAWEGGHQDHDALHALVVTLFEYLGMLERVRQFSLYNSFKCKGPFFRVMQPLKDNGKVMVYELSIVDRLKYIRLCLGYPSQKKTWLGLFPFVAYDYLF